MLPDVIKVHTFKVSSALKLKLRNAADEEASSTGDAEGIAASLDSKNCVNFKPLESLI